MCISPKYKSLTKDNYNKFVTKKEFEHSEAIAIGCGKCADCLTHKLQKKLSMWLLHINHLKKTNQKFYCYFITLTYAPENLWVVKYNPYKYQLQKLIKRWRKNFKLKNLKYTITTELGSKTGRIHNHLFVLSEKDFLPKQFGGKTIKGKYYYQNEAITWPFGYHSIKNINTDSLPDLEKTIKYVLKYVYKFPLGLMTSSKIGYEAIKAIENPKDSTFIYNGYKYKSPWAKNNLTNDEKMKLSLQFTKSKKPAKTKPLIDIETIEPDEKL